MKMIREYRPDAIWSTFPIATAHRIAAELHRRSKIPWIADFRDPMAQDGYPQDPIVWAQYKAIEENAMVNASYCTFTTPTATLSHQNRYAFAADRIRLLENGYDEESFASVEAGANSEPLNPGALTLLHSGIVYPEERDPTQLFEALRSLKDKGLVAAGSLRIRFRAAVQVELLRRLASQHGVGEFIEVMPSISYKPALAEMLRADALLVMQGSNCNEQVPAKVYEYIRANRPIVCLADPAGDTATVLRNSGIKLVARLDSVTEIEGALMRLLSPGNKSYQQVPTGSAVQQASRRQRSKGLAALLDSIK